MGDRYRPLLDRIGSWWRSRSPRDGAGFAVDNHGVDPDVEMTIAPHDWAAGHDPQLDTAVQLVLQALDQHPPATPPAI